jgi:DNA-binding CsgD family transcriptional regulator
MKLPAGLSDGNLEIFALNNLAWCFYNVELMQVSKLPKDIYEKLIVHMISHKEAVTCLHRMGLTDIDKMLEQFLICRYGAMDGTPDFEKSKENFTPEYHDCGKRGNCPFEFVLCDRVKIKTEKHEVFLTRKEIEIVKLIASGLTDIQTADKAGVALNTLLTHKKNIYSKLEINSQAQLTLVAVHNNLIQ